MINSAIVNGYSIVTYQRPLKASDELDKPIFTNQSQAVIWAIGPLNQLNEVSFHSQYTRGNLLLDFARYPKWNCPTPEGDQPAQEQLTQATKVKEAKGAAQSSTSTAQRRRTPSKDRNREELHSKVDEEGEESNNRGSAVIPNRSKDVPTPAPASKRNAWEIPAILCHEPEDGVFYAQMGPTGGKRGYPAITGKSRIFS